MALHARVCSYQVSRTLLQVLPTQLTVVMTHISVECILLVLRCMEGVAHASGSHTHKEIHMSLDHIHRSVDRARDEVAGVLTHEVVHCFQYSSTKCPGGLIEGIAGQSSSPIHVPSDQLLLPDYVRLHAGLSPPHWKREGGDKWDAGYQTTAYFLDWIEQRYGEGTVAELNLAMKNGEYDDAIFKDATGRKVGKLWKLYCGELEGRDRITTP
jgi:hypothetical protein